MEKTWNRLDKVSFRMEWSRTLALEICEALQYLEREKVQLFQLNPENIRIIDMGNNTFRVKIKWHKSGEGSLMQSLSHILMYLATGRKPQAHDFLSFSLPADWKNLINICQVAKSCCQVYKHVKGWKLITFEDSSLSNQIQTPTPSCGLPELPYSSSLRPRLEEEKESNFIRISNLKISSVRNSDSNYSCTFLLGYEFFQQDVDSCLWTTVTILSESDLGYLPIPNESEEKWPLTLLVRDQTILLMRGRLQWDQWKTGRKQHYFSNDEITVSFWIDQLTSDSKQNLKTVRNEKSTEDRMQMKEAKLY
jgi:hypothetical protein